MRVLYLLIIALLYFNNCSSQNQERVFILLDSLNHQYHKFDKNGTRSQLDILKFKFWGEGWIKKNEEISEDDIVIIESPEIRFLRFFSYNNPEYKSWNSEINFTPSYKVAKTDSEIWKNMNYPFYIYLVEDLKNGYYKIYKMKLMSNE